MISTQHGVPMYYHPPASSAMPSRSPQPPGGRDISHRRGRSTRRDFAFGTPPDYIPRSLPEELVRRGRQRARNFSEVATVGSNSNYDRQRSYSPLRRVDFAYAEPRSSNSHHGHSRSLSHQRSEHHHRNDPHPHRNLMPPRDVTPARSRPTNTRRRSNSVPSRRVVHNQGYYHPPNPSHAPTGTNMLAYGAQPIAVPVVESRGRPRKTGFFSRLKDTFAGWGAHDSRSRSVQPRQYVAYGSTAPGVYGTQGTSYAHL